MNKNDHKMLRLNQIIWLNNEIIKTTKNIKCQREVEMTILKCKISLSLFFNFIIEYANMQYTSQKHRRMVTIDKMPQKD